MSRYGIVESAFWQNPKSRRLTDTEALMLVYLFSSPHANSIGCYVLPAGYITADRPQWTSEIVAETLSKLSRYGFIERDEESGLTRIVGWFGHNAPANPKVMASMLKVIDALPPSPVTVHLIEAMLDSPNEHMQRRKPDLRARLDTLSKRYRNGSDTVSRDEPQNRTEQYQDLDLYQNQKAAAEAARRAEEKKPSRPRPSGAPSSPPKYARRLDRGGFETAEGEFVSAEEAFWALQPAAEDKGILRSRMGQLLRACGGMAMEAYDALMLTLKKRDANAYLSGIIRKRETAAGHAKAAANGTARTMPGDPKNVPAWVLELRAAGEIVTYNAPRKYWEHGGRGFDDDQNEVAF